ncbi:lysine decarboxylase [Rhodobacteraceae bacterium WD3A24]|nr:lysine decarboxylase [Rhodobacteraceae bacterium WD3A24]
MTTDRDRKQRHPIRRAEDDLRAAQQRRESLQAQAPAYRLAFNDPDFLAREELRPVRLQLELLKPELLMSEYGINSTIVLFGGARIPRPDSAGEAATPMLAELAHFYDEAREFARIVTLKNQTNGARENVIVTGGGPGVMEAGNRGAADAGGVSIGLNIVLPHEQEPNSYITPELCFNFHYFGIRKMHFLMRANALAMFPGGFGTLDELFEALTLIQTERMAPIPIILFGRDFWDRIVNWEALAEAGTISRSDLDLLSYVETAQEAVDIIDAFNPAGAGR